MKKILITGSNGFIGKALKKRLQQEGFATLEMNSDRDVTKTESFACFKDEDISFVFHLAGKTFVPESWKDPLSYYRINFTGTLNTLDFCRSRSIPLTFVSAYLYGQPSKLPISEDSAVHPNNPYAHSKHLAEQACEFYAREFGTKVIIMRPFNAYGAGQSDIFLIPYVIKQALECEEITVKDLSPKRDYIYLEDLVEALVLSMNSNKNLAVYNVGSGYSISVDEVIRIIQKELGINKRVVSQHTVRKNEINDVVADISALRRELGWEPRYSFDEGIRAILGKR